MALREIRIMGDDILAKPCRDVEKMTPRLSELIEDMIETMHDADGVGLAAPQVGVLRKIAVVDVSENGDEPIVLINPVLVESDGEQTGMEGCLSLPGKAGNVTRANHVIVKALNRDMEEVRYEGEELLARAMLHEMDHLDGHMFTERVEGELKDIESEEE